MATTPHKKRISGKVTPLGEKTLGPGHPDYVDPISIPPTIPIPQSKSQEKRLEAQTKTPLYEESTLVKIDQGIPIPNQGRRRRRKWPFHEMKVGDSFFAEGLKGSSGFCKAANVIGIKVTTRKCEENGVTGVRVWRFE